jgi:hypothetical protein
VRQENQQNDVAADFLGLLRCAAALADAGEVNARMRKDCQDILRLVSALAQEHEGMEQ